MCLLKEIFQSRQTIKICRIGDIHPPVNLVMLLLARNSEMKRETSRKSDDCLV